MSCDHELANEWVRCSGRNASYITIIVVHGLNHLKIHSAHQFCNSVSISSFRQSSTVNMYKWTFSNNELLIYEASRYENVRAKVYSL